MPGGGSSARQWFVEDKACSSLAAWDVQERFSFGRWPLQCDS